MRLDPLDCGSRRSVPFSDLSRTKLRPVIVLADAGRDDYILCPVTSKPYADPTAVTLAPASFASGSLPITSYARPGKLFTASADLIDRHVGALTPEALAGLVEAVVALLRGTTAHRD